MNVRSAEEIIDDNEKGAAELMIDVHDSIKDLDRKEAKEYIEKIVKNRYSMTPLINLSNIFFSALEKGCDFSEAVDDYMEDVEKSRDETIKYMKRILDERDHRHVATFSYSSTVVSAIEDVSRVSVFESRPVNEGRKTAEILSSKATDVEYWIDAGMMKGLEKCDSVIIGADTISDDGFLNKLGTYPLVLSAEEHNIPIFVAADISKYLPRGLTMSEGESHDPKEVWTPKKAVKIHNEYFEKVPLKYAEFVTGTNLFDVNEIKTKIEEKEVSELLRKYYPLR